MYAVSHLKSLWKRGKTKDPSPKVMRIKQNSEAFTRHFDMVQEQLETLASVDDLLSGINTACFVLLCSIFDIII